MNENVIVTMNESGQPELKLDYTEILKWLGNGISAVAKNPLEAWKINIEIKYINKILNLLDVKWYEVDWTKVNEIGFLEILKAAKNHNPEIDLDLTQKWKKLLQEYLDPTARNKAKLVRAAKLLEQLDTFSVNVLDIVYNSKIEDDLTSDKIKEFNTRGGDFWYEFDKLVSLGFFSYRASNGGPKYGESSDVNHAGVLHYNSQTSQNITIYKSRLFMDFMSIFNSNN